MKKCTRPSDLVLMVAIFISGTCFGQNCPDDSLLNLGTIDAHWFFSEKNLKISFPLPSGWYMYDYHAEDKKYLRIGSDYRKMCSDIFAGGGGAFMRLDQLKKFPLGVQINILGLSKFEDTATVILSPDERLDTSIIFSLGYTDTTDIHFFLKEYYKKIMRNAGDPPEIRPGKMGNLDYEFISITAPNKAGVLQDHLFCARNFGCFNLLIRIIYQTQSGRALIFDACKDLKLYD
jgi:hypothetical protein